MNSERNRCRSRIVLAVLSFVYSVLKLLGRMDGSLAERLTCHDHGRSS